MFERMRYLRVSLLKACNFNCFYCLPPSITSIRYGDITKPQKFKQAIAALTAMGVRRVRFTGGEPTLYRELCELISFSKSLDGELETALTTNARLLKRQAAELAAAGLDSVNISLDTANRQKFKEITGVDSLERVLAGVKAACDHFSQVKLNVVAMRGVNDDEFGDLVNLANDFGVDIRFIEYMPSRYGERRESGYISAEEILKLIPYDLQQEPTEGSTPARYYRAEGLTSRVGFITSISQPFCHSCDRIRLTSDGNLYTCLFSNRSINIFSLLKENPKLDLAAMTKFIAGKEFVAERMSLADQEYRPSFSEIGG